MDDAAVFPPGSASVADALAAHRQHRVAWYADLVGPLLLPASAVSNGALDGRTEPGAGLPIGLIGDTGIERLPAMLDRLGRDDGVRVRQLEAPVAKRGEDPQPGLAGLVRLAAQRTELDCYAEVPLSFGLLAALDTIAGARAGGCRIAAKFRTGGLAAELFPTPVELAAVICACRDRDVPFKLTAGLHHGLRHTDSETGFTHHGFVNVLAATAAAIDGAEVADVAELLGTTDPLRVVDPVRTRRDGERPLWIGFGSCSVVEPLTDLIRLGLVNGGFES